MVWSTRTKKNEEKEQQKAVATCRGKSVFWQVFFRALWTTVLELQKEKGREFIRESRGEATKNLHFVNGFLFPSLVSIVCVCVHVGWARCSSPLFLRLCSTSVRELSTKINFHLWQQPWPFTWMAVSDWTRSRFSPLAWTGSSFVCFLFTIVWFDQRILFTMLSLLILLSLL